MILLGGCGGDAPAPEDGGFDASAPGDDAGADSGPVALCARDLDCSDSLFCNGEERCMPGVAGASPEGCVAGDAPCVAGEICSEDSDACTPDDCVDEDGDGYETCMGDCDDSNPNINPGTEEFCVPDNPTDEDCNPRTYGFVDIDMDGAGDARCFNEDTDGTRYGGTDCDDSNASISPTAAEVCDGRFDENCDGTVDEDCLCSPEGSTRGCGTGLGECSGAVETCTASGWTTCSATPGTELCDGSRDENCDGSVDEGCSCVEGTTQACGRGACAGLQRCTGGSWAACDGITPTTETCDGIDTDCDGISDGDDPDVVGAGDLCGSDVGACVAGTMTCSGSALSCVGETTPRPEVCDGSTDENCNGMADEGCGCVNGTTQSCDRGFCAGTQRCVLGAWDTCDGSPPRTEMCNGTDDDCNGMTDDVLGIGNTCGSDVGACIAGTQACVGSSLSCVGAVGPATEVCDGPGVDEDCDGTSNEDCSCSSGTMQACGTGDCAGMQLCTAGAWGRCENPPGTAAPTPGTITEVCDGRDNSCNGMVDDVVGVGDACGSNVGECGAGTQSCVGSSLVCGGAGYVAPVTETCNHVDDNCDGATDEGVSVSACLADYGQGGDFDTNYTCYSRSGTGYACRGSLTEGARASYEGGAAYASWVGDWPRLGRFTTFVRARDTSGDNSVRGTMGIIVTPEPGVGIPPTYAFTAGLPALSPGTPAVAMVWDTSNTSESPRFYEHRGTVWTGPLTVNTTSTTCTGPSGAKVTNVSANYRFEILPFAARPRFVLSRGGSCRIDGNFHLDSWLTNFYSETTSYPRFYVGAFAWAENGDLSAEMTNLSLDRRETALIGNACDGC